MPNDTQIQRRYHSPEDYTKILSRLVYAKLVKDGDPFAMDPDKSYPGLIIENHPLRSLQESGFMFQRGNHVSHSPATQTVLIVADPKTHEELVDFHAKLGIKIVSDVPTRTNSK